MLSTTAEKCKRFCTHAKTDENVYCVFLSLVNQSNAKLHYVNIRFLRYGFSFSRVWLKSRVNITEKAKL